MEAPQIEELADKVIRGRLNVRATEALVRSARAKIEGKKNGASNGAHTGKEKSAAIKDLEQRLTRTLGTKVEVRDNGNRGEIVIPYADLDALDRLLEKLI